jgi:type I restriction enzyme S subunit
LPDGWGVVKFGDLLDGPTRNGVYKPKKFHGTGTKMINMGELFAFPRIEQPKMKRVQLSATELDRFAVQAGDLLFARRSLVAEGAGKCSLVLGEGEPRAFESSIIRARPDKEKAVPVFLYYLFSSTYGRYLMSSILRQVAVSGIASSDLVNLEVPLPPLNEQQAIASILGSLDDKIELNRRMNETLEALARALFKSWFVDFDPVHAKMAGRQPVGMDDETAALFPDSLEDSTIGEIPKGWRVGKMAEIASQRRVTLSPETEPEELFDHYSIPAFDEGRMPKVESGEQIKSNKFVVPENAVLLSRLNPRILRCWLPQIGTSRRSVCSTEYIVACPEPPFTREFLFSLFTSLPFVGEFQNLVTGTSGSHQRVKAEYWHSMDVLIPDAEIVDQFTTLARNLFLKTATNAQQNLTLAAIRDALLPKLLSGEVRVGEAERIVEERVGGRRTSPAER